MNQVPLPGQHPEEAIGVFPDHVLKSRTTQLSVESKLDSKYVAEPFQAKEWMSLAGRLGNAAMDCQLTPKPRDLDLFAEDAFGFSVAM